MKGLLKSKLIKLLVDVINNKITFVHQIMGHGAGLQA